MSLSLRPGVDNTKDVIPHFTPSLAPTPQKKPTRTYTIHLSLAPCNVAYFSYRHNIIHRRYFEGDVHKCSKIYMYAGHRNCIYRYASGIKKIKSGISYCWHFSQGKNTFSVPLNQRMAQCKRWHALPAGVNTDWCTCSITLNLTLGFPKSITRNGNVLCAASSHHL